jgi:hypothetical protein
MSKVILCTFLILLLVPFSQGFSQVTNTPSTLTLYINENNLYVYQNSDGFTVVVGIVENNNSLTPVSNVKIKVNFYDDADPTPLEVTQGTTTLEVIPINGKSTFSIVSETPNPQITQVSVSFVDSPIPVAPKTPELTVYSTDVFLDNSFQFSGVLQNGKTSSSNTNVYLAFYDVFERILRVDTIELGDIDPNTEISFEFDEVIDSTAKGFLLFAESSVSISDFVDIQIPASQILDKLITIRNVSVEDSNGNKVSELKVDSTFHIKSETKIEFISEIIPEETAYTYYVQIKKSSEIQGDPQTVEYIGKFDGRFIESGLETQIIDWKPKQSGFFFIETFVWDRNNIPIAEQGPYTIIIVK